MELTPPPYPDMHFASEAAKALGSLAAVVYLACLGGETLNENDLEAKTTSLMGSIRQAIDNSVGNRNRKAAVTWSDMRYLLAGSLRTMIEELENPTND